jgi:hypothetical protein
VFTGRAGLDYALWWASVGSTRAHVSGNPSKPAQGGVWGASAAVSMGLSLDYFTKGNRPYGLDRIGQDSYVFVEYMLLHAHTLFKRHAPPNLSDYGMLNVGLSLDFR